MKDVNYFFLVLCSVLYIGVLSACDDKETPAIMNIESVCGNYAVEQVKMTFNGVDMPALGNISLTLDTSYDDNVGEVDGSRKMTLEMPLQMHSLKIRGVITPAPAQGRGSAFPRSVLPRGTSGRKRAVHRDQG